MGSIFMEKQGFTAEEKIKVIKLHIEDGMGYGAISDRYGVPIATLCHWIRKYQRFGRMKEMCGGRISNQ